MEMENFVLLMDQLIPDIGGFIKCMVKADILKLMDKFTKEFGRIIKQLEKYKNA